MMSGRSALAIRPVMRSRVAAVAVAGAFGTATQSGTVTACCWMSSGTTITTGPGWPEVAMRTALKAISPSCSGDVASATHLAILPKDFW